MGMGTRAVGLPLADVLISTGATSSSSSPDIPPSLPPCPAGHQLAIEQYWKTVGGTAFLPGTSRASDRFARASFFVNTIPRGVDPNIISAVPDRKCVGGRVAQGAVASDQSLQPTRASRQLPNQVGSLIPHTNHPP
jgi:hypothetical protein